MESSFKALNDIQTNFKLLAIDTHNQMYGKLTVPREYGFRSIW